MKIIQSLALVACCASCLVSSEQDVEYNDMLASDLSVQGPSTGPVLPGGAVFIPPSSFNAPCASSASCNDGNPCSIDSCVSGKCVHSDDAYLKSCTINDSYGFCSSGACCVGCIDSSTGACVQKCPNNGACTIQHICQ